LNPFLFLVAERSTIEKMLLLLRLPPAVANVAAVGIFIEGEVN
jgi:hypothetical protein